MKKVFFFFILFPFFLFSLDIKPEVFPSIISINKKSLNAEINFEIPFGWLLYSNENSANGSPLKITLNDKSANIQAIEIAFPESIKTNGDFFYISKQQTLIKFNFKGNINLNESDFLIVSYIMCNKKSGECVKNLQNISLKLKNNA